MFCQKKRIEIMPQVVDTTQKRITLNVGGQKHETYLSTIRNYPDTRLYWVVENVTKAIDYHSEKIELFFDRHPKIFDQVLNYYRTGKLHCPNDVCGPLFEEELAYWGIDEKEMEPCCWTTYTQHREAEHNLKSFNVTDFSTDIDSDRQEETETTSKAKGLHPFWVKYQPRIWAILEEPRSSRTAKAFWILSVLLIVLSVATACAITLPQFATEGGSVSSESSAYVAFTVIEYICGVWFTIELGLRLLFCPNKRTFFKSYSFWVDVLSVIPFYVRLIFPHEHDLADALQVIRLLRLFRFFRLLYGLQVIMHTLKASSYELFLLLLILLIPVVLFSSIIYYVEKNIDGKTTKFRSIPESFWWSLITMTTVGYGDMTPRTWEGKIIGGACAIFGVLMVALPISVIGSNFSLYYAHAQARLKLPKKKTKIHFDTLATAMPRQGLHRRRAMRRRSPGSSSACDQDGLSLRSRNNSTTRQNNLDVRSWSMSSNKSVPEKEMTEIRPPSAKAAAIRRAERRVSRNERSPPKLGDLIEHENEDAFSPSPNSSLLQPRLSLSVPRPNWDNRYENQSMWLAPDDRTLRSRSHSMPSNAQRPPLLNAPRNSYSPSAASTCVRCSLPVDDGDTSITSGMSNETCQCQNKQGRHSNRGSATFTVLVPSTEGINYDSMIQISTENIPTFTKEMPCLGTSPVQLEFYSERPFGIQSEYKDLYVDSFHNECPLVSSDESEAEVEYFKERQNSKQSDSSVPLIPYVNNNSKGTQDKREFETTL